MAGGRRGGREREKGENKREKGAGYGCPRSRFSIRYLPRSLLTNGLVLNGSISSICSPVPMNVIGLLVAATLEGERERERERERDQVATITRVHVYLRTKSSSPFCMPIQFSNYH